MWGNVILVIVVLRICMIIVFMMLIVSRLCCVIGSKVLLGMILVMRFCVDFYVGV